MECRARDLCRSSGSVLAELCVVLHDGEHSVLLSSDALERASLTGGARYPPRLGLSHAVGLSPERPLGLVFPLTPSSRGLVLAGGGAVRSSIQAKLRMEPVAAPSVDEVSSGQQGLGLSEGDRPPFP